MIKEVTLPSGKTLNIKFKAMDSVEKINYLLFGAYNDVHIPEHIVIGKCNKCGSDITIKNLTQI